MLLQITRIRKSVNVLIKKEEVLLLRVVTIIDALVEMIIAKEVVKRVKVVHL